MRWLRFTLLLTVLAILQAGFVDIISILSVKPDILIAALVFCAIYFHTNQAILTSFAIGFAADLSIGGYIVGSYTLAFGLVGCILAYLCRYIVLKRMPYQAFAIFITAFIAGCLAWVVADLRSTPGPLDPYGNLLWQCLYSAVLGPFLFLPFAGVMNINLHEFVKSK